MSANLADGRDQGKPSNQLISVETRRIKENKQIQALN